MNTPRATPDGGSAVPPRLQPGSDPDSGQPATLLARTFAGLTWRRFGLVSLFVLLTSISYVVGEIFAAKVPTPEWTALAFLSVLVGGYARWMPVWFAVIAVDNWTSGDSRKRRWALPCAIAAGLLAGAILMQLSQAMFRPLTLDMVPRAAGNLVMGIFVAIVATIGYLFVVREDKAAATLHGEAMARVALERELAEARLQVMQAQVEPHFLFNTLANVRRLYHVEPPAAQAMLRDLSRYLTAALPRMRDAHATLGQELTLVDAYLSVQKIRMGDRLTFEIDAPESLRGTTVPPMMLMTLVENAVKHGVGPVPEGGHVRVSARLVDERLRLQVADTGRGLQESSGSGTGLANIRARLNTLYGTAARLLLAQDPGGGVTATLEIPVPADPAAARAA
jgi:signal transduction histidine kinase